MTKKIQNNIEKPANKALPIKSILTRIKSLQFIVVIFANVIRRVRTRVSGKVAFTQENNYLLFYRIAIYNNLCYRLF